MISLDAESRAWLDDLREPGARRNRALARLHELLLRVAHAEARRRAPRLPDAVVADLDDICQQAADDALWAVIGKLETFEGRSRFTTWAYKFAVFEVSTRLRRHAWHAERLVLDDAGWERLTDARQLSAHSRVENREVLDVLTRAVGTELSARQREVFTAVALSEVPVDVVAERLRSSRGAVYKTLHDARRKLRAALAAGGYAEVLP